MVLLWRQRPAMESWVRPQHARDRSLAGLARSVCGGSMAGLPAIQGVRITSQFSGRGVRKHRME